MKLSPTIIGVIVALVTNILKLLGVEIPETDIVATINTLVTLATLLIAYIERQSKGDVGMLGQIKG